MQCLTSLIKVEFLIVIVTKYYYQFTIYTIIVNAEIIRFWHTYMCQCTRAFYVDVECNKIELECSFEWHSFPAGSEHLPSGCLLESAWAIDGCSAVE